MNDFELKRAERAERFRARAERARREADARWKGAEDILRFIPPGQPILVGHHSERRHRRDLAKVDNHMRKSIEAREKAARLEARAEAAEENDAIYDEDPEALEKLRAKLAKLEERHALDKKINRAVRSKAPREKLAELGLKDGTISRLLEGDFAGRKGIPGYVLSNRNANMRRIRGRIERLEREAERTEADRLHLEGNGWEVFEDGDDHRVVLKFDARPAREITRFLRSMGWRWAPSRGAWLRHLNGAGRASARAVAAHLEREL